MAHLTIGQNPAATMASASCVENFGSEPGKETGLMKRPAPSSL
jgi:hypothetical protein